jgi:MFS family permease
MFFGPYGDKFGARKTFGFCLIAAGISMVQLFFIFELVSQF